MAKKNFSVRLSDPQKEGLEALSKATKLNVNQLISLGTDALLDYAKRHDGRLVLPLDFEANLDIKSLKKKGAANPKISGMNPIRAQAVG